MIKTVTRNDLYALNVIPKAIVIFYKNDSWQSLKLIDMLDEFKNESSNIDVVKIEIEDYIEKEFNIKMVPTIIAYAYGKEIGRISNYNTIDMVLKFFE